MHSFIFCVLKISPVLKLSNSSNLDLDFLNLNNLKSINDYEIIEKNIYAFDALTNFND